MYGKEQLMSTDDSEVPPALGPEEARERDRTAWNLPKAVRRPPLATAATRLALANVMSDPATRAPAQTPDRTLGE